MTFVNPNAPVERDIYNTQVNPLSSLQRSDIFIPQVNPLFRKGLVFDFEYLLLNTFGTRMRRKKGGRDGGCSRDGGCFLIVCLMTLVNPNAPVERDIYNTLVNPLSSLQRSNIFIPQVNPLFTPNYSPSSIIFMP